MKTETLIRLFKINDTVWEVFWVQHEFKVHRNGVLFTNGNTSKDGLFETETEAEINIMMQYAVNNEVDSE